MRIRVTIDIDMATDDELGTANIHVKGDAAAELAGLTIDGALTIAAGQLVSTACQRSEDGFEKALEGIVDMAMAFASATTESEERPS